MSGNLNPPKKEDLLPTNTTVKPGSLYKVFVLKTGARVPDDIGIVAEGDHVTFHCRNDAGTQVTLIPGRSLADFDKCYVVEIGRLNWECHGCIRAGGELAPRWLRDSQPWAVLAAALDTVVDLSADVEITSGIFAIGEILTKFTQNEVQSADFRRQVLQPLQEILEIFLEGDDYEPDEIGDILNSLEVLKRTKTVEVSSHTRKHGSVWVAGHWRSAPQSHSPRLQSTSSAEPHLGNSGNGGASSANTQDLERTEDLSGPLGRLGLSECDDADE
jgi:hypothetical protein